ncbi:DUF2508 family protein [Paenibacillus hamazuiensis]|uniref:DUF2508 family protein n=1 Tax=Paenibacillus hamazuiensis TaxID=2936508 RepID=UPI0020108481|nr:DUF2508 family protein [Paenibacillus hamazuiensis]
MNLWPLRTRTSPKVPETVKQDRLELLQEIKKAHLDWVTAQKHFDFVLEKEQIDYAVYALEAAEKRYEMLLRQAKRLGVTSEVFTKRAKEVSGP